MGFIPYVLFFCSGVSGLIYQVVWVREFGLVFGNTVYSASLVVAIFMLGLGAGGLLGGAWADRRYVAGPVGWRGRLHAYAALEVVIAALGFAVALALPRLVPLVARFSAYVPDANGWMALSGGSYLFRGAVATLLLVPITMAMGATLTVLIRHVAEEHQTRSSWAVGLLYGVNTLGAALGALLTDFTLVPQRGLFETQLIAVALNVFAAAGALILSLGSAASSPFEPPVEEHPSAPPRYRRASPVGLVRSTAAMLALSGFAALGMEILWLRHLSVMLGGFRAVFSLLVATMLVALGAGAFVGGWLDHRFGRPRLSLALTQAAFAVLLLVGLVSNGADGVVARSVAFLSQTGGLTPDSLMATELWFNLRPMLLEVALPAFVGGLTFPLANALVQRLHAEVGQRAGFLYLANAVGGVCGALATGYLLLPFLGMQGTAALLSATATLAIVPLYLAREGGEREGRPGAMVGIASVGVVAVLAWAFLPGDFLTRRAIGTRGTGERLLTVSEGPNELLAVVEADGRGRGLLTNGHAMSSTARLDQRYMRALAHVPLLAMERPTAVLVIGFGVGNTTHAASLHPSVTRVDVADLSRNILEHASYFDDANHGVLQHAKVSVFVNDGRMHLQMAAPSTYDLVTLEPPPISHAGVGSLYSREFYQLAKSRLKAGGYVSQWLPAYQVPPDASLAMVRAFVDVFPQSVLLSGSQAELILLGTNGPSLEIDPVRVTQALAQTPAVRADLEGVELSDVRDLAATFVGSADTLRRATLESTPAIDDRPVQEYGVLSQLTSGLMGVPASLFELTALPAWCPRCYADGRFAETVSGLDLRMALLQQAYVTPPVVTAASMGRSLGERRLLGSAYLGAVVPDNAEVHNVLGVAALREGRGDDAVVEFEAALARDANSANARGNLSTIRLEQAAPLMAARRYAEAVPLLRVAVNLIPDDPEARNDLGVALASLGNVGEAVEHFTRALALAPDFDEARRNLAAAQAATAQRP